MPFLDCSDERTAAAILFYSITSMLFILVASPMGEWFALPLIEHAGSMRIGDAVFSEIFHPISRRLVAKCDACLRIGGPSVGADEMVAISRGLGKPVSFSLDEVPAP
jgi:hypothetical protein